MSAQLSTECFSHLRSISTTLSTAVFIPFYSAIRATNCSTVHQSHLSSHRNTIGTTFAATNMCTDSTALCPAILSTYKYSIATTEQQPHFATINATIQSAFFAADWSAKSTANECTDECADMRAILST